MTSLTEETRQWRLEIERELDGNILSFWLKHAPDERFGGFVGEIRQDMTRMDHAEKSLVLNTRILWTFSTAYRLFRKEEYLEAANRAYRYIHSCFIDKLHGGLYWMLDAEGRPVSAKKQIYGQAFAIYAWSEYYRATGNPEALEEAAGLYRLIEKYGRDPLHLGYIEALAEDWSTTDELSLSDKDLNEKKSMNTHLHVLEGYTNLYRIWPDESLRKSLGELIQITMDYIVDPKTGHFKLFFDEAWNSKSGHISYGHDIEGSWLLHEAAEVLGDEALLQKAKAVAVLMAEATLREGIDAEGGIPNEADSSGLIDANRDWWPQAEAVVGFYNAYELTGDKRYAESAKASWKFIQDFLVDREHGEWHWSVTKDGEPVAGHPKVGAWKCPYHNGRACFEMLERLSR
ncbi:AGE family epimerase/isomerase [Paenibacillus sp. BK720]|uniref:AGE family epimerase/isomerase n=1 Tax=Paenibacillus sp. BK720 TaxID=2587092 RepID=UPI001424054B|nr:AGE family epimerase/isomerase [Paenibacillus sp. BK720]NIK68165.1 mannobiose 2-epimerase [Paenibacillus sp. BK720]